SRSLAHQPLCQVLIAFQGRQPLVDLPGLDSTLRLPDIGIARFDLSFVFTEHPDAGAGHDLELVIEYRTDLFERTTVQRMTRQLEWILRAVTRDADVSVRRVELLTADERKSLAGQDATGAGITPRTAVSLFEDQVGDAPALVFKDQSLSYEDLNARANQLAHHLIRLGAGPDTLVGVAMPRSPEMVVAVLAVLKSGAAYLPIDPGYPRARIAFMLDDARPMVVVTTSDLVHDLPDTTLTLVFDDDTTRELGGSPVTNPTDADRSRPLLPQDCAYLIYTSGSTGIPKGVQVPHSGVASLAATHVDRLGAGPGSRVLQFAALSFDAAFWEMCMSLFTGGTFVLASAERLMPGPALAQLVRDHQVTHLTLPPTALAQLAEDGLPTGITLVVAGEACPPDLVKRWAPGRAMINAYGPTETTVCATMSDPLDVGGEAPIGRPVHDTRV
ncbi:AMP-binding protein, partial [Amycolatopsis vastitatis]